MVLWLGYDTKGFYQIEHQGDGSYYEHDITFKFKK